SDDRDLEDDVLCSPPSWQALATAGEDSDPDDDGASCSEASDHSPGRWPVLDDDHAETKAILDMYLRSSQSGKAQDENGEEEKTAIHEEGNYFNLASKGRLTKSSSSTRKSVIFSESGIARDIGHDIVGEEEPGISSLKDAEDYSRSVVQGQKEGLSQRSRTPSDRDSESVYDTVSSTSSAAPLLRKITQYLPAENPVGANDPDEGKPTSKSNSLGEHRQGTVGQDAGASEEESRGPVAVPRGRSLPRHHGRSGGTQSVQDLPEELGRSQPLLHDPAHGLLLAPQPPEQHQPPVGARLGRSMANFYSSFYTIIPASLLLGCTMSSLWVAQGSYLTSIAVAYASLTGKKHEGIIGLFNGFFLFWLQTAQILGNLLSSFVFNISIWSRSEVDSSSSLSVTEAPPERRPPPVTVEYNVIDLDDDDVHGEWFPSSDVLANQTSPEGQWFCGATYCHSYAIEHPDLHLGQFSLYVLLAIFLALTVTSMALAALFLDKLDVIFRKNQASLRQQLSTMVRFHNDYKVWLLCVLLVFVGMQQAYMFGEVTKAFINCPLGIHMIGYVMVCFGACDSLVSFTCGQLQRCSSTKVFITIGAVLHLVLLGVMLLWQPTADDVSLVFLLAGSLGAADAIWQTQICSKLMIKLLSFTKLNPTRKETIFSYLTFGCLRMYEGIGFTVAFAYAQYLCMATKTCILIGVLLVGLICYYVMEHLEKKHKTSGSSFPPVDV
ncbi:hypothetical protein LSH36_232g02007, partial [Paralvinella palmiformis]